MKKRPHMCGLFFSAECYSVALGQCCYLFSDNSLSLSGSFLSHTFDSLSGLFGSLRSDLFDSGLGGGGVSSSGVAVASYE